MIGYLVPPFVGGRLLKIRLAYFYHIGHYINGLMFLRVDTPFAQRGTIVYPALECLRLLTTEEYSTKIVPRIRDAAVSLLPLVEKIASGSATTQEIEQLPLYVQATTVTINEELERIYAYQMSGKGNFSIDSLVNGASQGYPANVLSHLDDFVASEIDDAGLCLACGLYTACGFHIFRSVEIVIKGYVHAATGNLPPVNRRSWGEYISQLTNAGASSDVIDVLKILKTKRNPLMHPQDTLDESDAIDVFCLCQSVTSSLVRDIERRQLEQKFKASLVLLPTI